MASKDRSKEPPATAEHSPKAGKVAATETEWPRLLARLVEGVVSAELHEFEDNVMAFIDTAIADVSASLIWAGAKLIGAAFLLTGLMLFLGVFLQWWAAFGLVGVVIIVLGAVVSAIRRPRRRRSRR